VEKKLLPKGILKAWEASGVHRPASEEFQGLEDTGAVRLAAYHGAVGANSSGKTSLLQALLLLKQNRRVLGPVTLCSTRATRRPIGPRDGVGRVVGHDLTQTLEITWAGSCPSLSRSPATPNGPSVTLQVILTPEASRRQAGALPHGESYAVLERREDGRR